MEHPDSLRLTFYQIIRKASRALQTAHFNWIKIYLCHINWPIGQLNARMPRYPIQTHSSLSSLRADNMKKFLLSPMNLVMEVLSQITELSLQTSNQFAIQWSMPEFVHIVRF
jgi:hypothetical protein